MSQISWNTLSRDQKVEMKDMFFDWLKSQRLTNYGYDWKDFKNLSNKASRLRSSLKHPLNLNFDANYGILNRLIIENGEVTYIVGQSFNEEYITLLECLIKRK